MTGVQTCALPILDALVVISHREDRSTAAGQQAQPAVLEHVGVLELVDQNVRESTLIVFADELVALQELVAAQKQFGKVDDPLALARAVPYGEPSDPWPQVRDILDDARTALPNGQKLSQRTGRHVWPRSSRLTESHGTKCQFRFRALCLS